MQSYHPRSQRKKEGPNVGTLLYTTIHRRLLSWFSWQRLLPGARLDGKVVTMEYDATIVETKLAHVHLEGGKPTP